MRSALKSSVALAAIAACACVQSVYGAPVSIGNAGFEDVVLANGGFSQNVSNPVSASPSFAGSWTKGGSQPTFSGTFDVTSASGFDPTDADNNYLDLAMGTSAQVAAGSFINVTQTLDGGGQRPLLTIQPNTRYTLDLDVGHHAGNQFPAVGNADSSSNNTNNLQTRLVATGQTSFAGQGDVTLVSSTAGPIANGALGHYTLIYETGANPTGNIGGGSLTGTTLYVQLFLTNGGGAPGSFNGGPYTTNFTQVMIDNVTLDVSPVPEPASLGLLGIAAVGLLARRRRAV